MTTISAQIIADSVSPDKIRLTTMQLRYPRFIHAEFMTHRVFSRNASSSRAVPVKRTIQWVTEDTAMPRHWGKNQKGMQAEQECNEPIDYVQNIPMTREQGWELSRNFAIEMALKYDKAGYHKQIVNRLLEPFAHINVVVSSTKWANFFKLRDHKDAMPEIQELARAMKAAMDASKPLFLYPGDWHLPYVSDEEKHGTWLEHRYVGRDNSEEWDFKTANLELAKISTARCARVSYLTTEGKKPNVEEDLALYQRLMGDPLHASPAEHQATPDEHFLGNTFLHQWEHGNFHGWRQFRKMHPNEAVEDKRYDDAALEDFYSA